MSEGFKIYTGSGGGSSVPSNPDYPSKALINMGSLTTNSPRSTSRGTNDHYCKILKLPLINGQYTRIVLPSLTFDEYVYIRRPNGTLFSEADNAASMQFMPDVTGDWTYEITTYNPNNVGTYSIRWNRTPLDEEIPLSKIGEFVIDIETGWLSPSTMNAQWAAWVKWTANGSVTLDVIAETFDDYVYLLDNSKTIVAQSDSPPITQTLANGTYFAVVRAFSFGYFGSGMFKLSGGITS